jgi:hypothetical protein
LHEIIDWKSAAGTPCRFTFDHSMASNILNWNIVSTYESFGESDQRVELLSWYIGLFEISHKTNANAEEISGEVVSRNVGTPDIEILPPIACDFPQS